MIWKSSSTDGNKQFNHHQCWPMAFNFGCMVGSWWYDSDNIFLSDAFMLQSIFPIDNCNHCDTLGLNHNRELRPSNIIHIIENTMQDIMHPSWSERTRKCIIQDSSPNSVMNPGIAVWKVGMISRGTQNLISNESPMGNGDHCPRSWTYHRSPAIMATYSSKWSGTTAYCN